MRNLARCLYRPTIHVLRNFHSSHCQSRLNHGHAIFSHPCRSRCAVWPKVCSVLCNKTWTPSLWQHRAYVPWRLKDSVPDLQRFLREIGTDPKEARFWLKQFLNVNLKKPFAVIEIDPDIFDDQDQLEQMASSVSFLQRNCLRPVLVYGDLSTSTTSSTKPLQELKSSLVTRGKVLCDALRQQSLETCILFSGSGVLQAGLHNERSEEYRVKAVNLDLIEWNMERQIVPIIPASGETTQGQIVSLGLWDVTSAVSKRLQPLKVIRISCRGGFQDSKGQVIANVSLPFDFETAKDKSWCTDKVVSTIREVGLLLNEVPARTSVVITAADSMLQELFTHHGSGTFLKITEPILEYKSFDDIDTERLSSLLTMSFGKELSKSYFEDVQDLIHTIYLSERYMAAAIILQFPDCEVPYLCKFAVSAQAQGEGTGEIVWESMQRKFKRLFWRSRGSNPINPWYFKKSEGSWSNGQWTVFWYGIPEPQLSMDLIEKALTAPESFTLVSGPDAKQTESAEK